MVSSNERNGDSHKSRAARKSFLVILLVAEHVVDSTKAGDCARDDHRAHPRCAYANTTILGGLGLESNGADLVSTLHAEEIEPAQSSRDESDENGEVRRGSVECRNERFEAGKRAVNDWRSV